MTEGTVDKAFEIAGTIVVLFVFSHWMGWWVVPLAAGFGMWRAAQ